MRSGQYIRALGRQSFEPSQPASSDDGQPLPSEESTERQRQLIKAQNDVLATVGVCRLDNSKQGLERSGSFSAENEAGLVIGAVDLTVTYLVSWPLVGIRNRLETYRVEPDLRYRDVIKLAWTRNSFAELLSGMPAHILFQITTLVKDYYQARFIMWISKKSFFMDPLTERPRNRGWLRALDVCMSFGSWFLIYPLFYHSDLQCLHLLGPSPVLPPLRSFIPFSSASPLSIPIITAPLLSTSGIMQLLTAGASSYVIHSFFLHSFSVTLQSFLFPRILSLLPNPHTPIGLENSEKYAWANIDMTFQEVMDAETAIQAAIAAEDDEDSDSFPAIEIAELDAARPRTYTATPVPHETAQNPLLIDSESGSPPESPAVAPPAPAPVPADRRSLYRSTTLATHPVDVFAGHLSDFFPGVLAAAAESVVMRMLARSVLRKRGLSEWAVDKIVCRPLEPVGAGLVAKTLVAGEAGLMFALFQVTYAASTVVGVRWFGYPRNV